MVKPASFHPALTDFPGLLGFLVLVVLGDAFGASITWEYHHRHWTRSDGLPDTRIHFLAQSGDGYLWMGTRGGLVRFDGRTFVAYTRANTGLLERDEILSGITDEAGDLHVVPLDSRRVTWNGWGLLSDPFTEADSRTRWHLPLARSGTRRWLVWDANYPRPRITRWDPSLALLTDLPGNALVFEDRAGTVYDLLPGRMRVHAPENRQEHTYTLPEVSPQWSAAMSQTPDGRVWMRYGDAKQSRLQLYRIEASGPVPVGSPSPGNTGRPEFLLATHRGELWQPVGGIGLDRFADGRFARFSMPWGREFDTALCMFEDREGNLWVGAEENGLHQLRPRRFRALTPDHGLPDAEIRSVYAASNQVWVGTDRGLARVDAHVDPDPDPDPDPGPESRAVASPFHVHPIVGPFEDGSTRARSIRSLAMDVDGQVWAGSDRGLFRVRGDECVALPLPELRSLYDQDSLQTRKLRALVPDGAGGLWLTSAAYLMHGAPDASGTYHFTAFGTPPPGPHGLLRDRSGWMWVACPGLGVGCFEPRRMLRAAGTEPTASRGPTPALASAPSVHWLRTTNGLSSDHAWHLYEDRDGAIWVATENGLDRISPTSAEAIRGASVGGPTAASWEILVLTAAHGLPDPQVRCVVEDDVGDFWLGTGKGIARVARRDIEAWIQRRSGRLAVELFGQSDGLPSAEISGQLSHPSVTKAGDGRLWFATSQGVATVDPREVRQTHTPPLTAIEEVRADDEPIFSTFPRFAEGANPAPSPPPPTAAASVPGTGTHRLAPGRARILEFGFTALHFADAEACRFRYRLDGYDPEGVWHDAGNRRTAYFTNLDPGEYRFQVQAASRLGDWSARSASFGFGLEAHYWQTWPFRVGAILAFAGLVAGLVNWRAGELRRLQRLQLERSVLSERLELARDLHDIVGAQFTELIQLGERAGQLPLEQAVHHQRRMADLARELFRSVRHSMWATTPEADNLPALVDYLESAARRLAGPAGLEVSLDLPDTIPAIPLSPMPRRHIFLAAQEALNNAVKHSRATRIVLRLRCEPTSFVLEIDDDGCGMDHEAMRRANAEGEFRRGKVSGNGLPNIRHRLREAGGTAEFVARPEGGLRVRLRIPC